MNPASNLIPKGWAERRERRRAHRRWLASAACGTALTALLTAATAWQASAVRATSASGIDLVTAEVQSLNAEAAELDAACEEMRRRLRAASRFTGHPDWSILLRYLVEACGEDVRMSQVSLAPAEDAPEAPGFEVIVAGAATKQQAVSGLTLTLERAGPLHGVRILSSRRAPNSGGIAFQVRFEIGGRPVPAAGTVVEVPTP